MDGRHGRRNRWAAATLPAGLLLLAACRPAPVAPEPPTASSAAPASLRTPTRALWVTRFDYKQPQDVTRAVALADELGFDTVLFQVRGDATVSYPSQLEPWSRQFGHHDPGFDPLRVAIDEAHRRGLRLEAWINVMPGWQGKQPPAARDHLHHVHPDWFLHDAQGRRQPLGDWYVSLNPCLPEVRRHIVDVAAELLSAYDVDGLHLDYVRFAWDQAPDAIDHYPRDSQTLAIYARQTGRTPQEDRRAWRGWLANQVTRLVAEIRRMRDEIRPTCTLTAATWGVPADGLADSLQNAPGWLRAGLLDAAYPMTYARDAETFVRLVREQRALALGGRVIPGVALFKLESTAELWAQLQPCREWGGDLAAFAYDSLAPRESGRDAAAAQSRTDVLRQFLREE